MTQAIKAYSLARDEPRIQGRERAAKNEIWSILPILGQWWVLWEPLKKHTMCSTKELALIFMPWHLAGLKQHHSHQTLPLSSFFFHNPESKHKNKWEKWRLKEETTPIPRMGGEGEIFKLGVRLELKTFCNLKYASVTKNRTLFIHTNDGLEREELTLNSWPWIDEYSWPWTDEYCIQSRGFSHFQKQQW